MTYDFAGKISYGTRLYLILCHDLQHVAELQFELRR